MESMQVFPRSIPQPLQARPIPVASGSGFPAHPVSFATVLAPGAGPARAASYASQVARRAPSSLRLSYPARAGSQRGPPPIPQRAPNSQHFSQRVQSFQGRAPTHQIPSRPGSFPGLPTAPGNRRTPSFQGRSFSNPGPVVNASNLRAPSFQGRGFSHLRPIPQRMPSFPGRVPSQQIPSRAGSFLGAPQAINHRNPSFQRRTNSGVVPTRSHEPSGYRPYIHALHRHYGQLFRVERGHHFDHVDDGVVASYTQARNWDTECEPEVVLTIGGPVNPDKKDAVWAWKFPIAFLGLRYNMLELAFPLNQASVEKLPNDVLRVLHVRLQDKHHGSINTDDHAPSDADMAETQQQVLQELERRGFHTATVRGVQTQHIQGKPRSSDAKKEQSGKTRPNASVLQPDRVSGNPVSSSRHPYQQTLQYSTSELLQHLNDCRREIQDGPVAFARSHGRMPVVRVQDTDAEDEDEDEETDQTSGLSTSQKVKFDHRIPERTSMGKGKARATEIYEVEDKAEASDFALAVEAPEVSGVEHDTSDYTGKSPDIARFEDEDLYDV